MPSGLEVWKKYLQVEHNQRRREERPGPSREMHLDVLGYVIALGVFAGAVMAHMLAVLPR